MTETNQSLTAHQVRQTLAAFLSAQCEPGDRVIVAVSGGTDSLALAAVLGPVAQDFSLEVIAVVVDHQLQPGSADIARTAGHACQKLGIKDVRIVQVEVKANAGIEADARHARYAALQHMAKEADAKAVLLAHTLDDQAETVLLRLARGSGTRSIAAMRPATNIEGGRPLWRPFLGTTRADLALTLAHYGVSAHEDVHNSDERFLRVRIRQQVMPALRAAIGPNVDESLARTAMLAQMDADALDLIASRVFKSVVVDTELDTAEIVRHPMAIQTRVLRSWLVSRNAPSATLTFEHVLAVHRLIIDPRITGPVKVAGGLEVHRSSGRLRA
jgi:tRNA(Ile)-lysidine synthase